MLRCRPSRVHASLVRRPTWPRPSASVRPHLSSLHQTIRSTSATNPLDRIHRTSAATARRPSNALTTRWKISIAGGGYLMTAAAPIDRLTHDRSGATGLARAALWRFSLVRHVGPLRHNALAPAPGAVFLRHKWCTDSSSDRCMQSLERESIPANHPRLAESRRAASRPCRACATRRYRASPNRAIAASFSTIRPTWAALSSPALMAAARVPSTHPMAGQLTTESRVSCCLSSAKGALAEVRQVCMQIDLPTAVHVHFTYGDDYHRSGPSPVERRADAR